MFNMVFFTALIHRLRGQASDVFDGFPNRVLCIYGIYLLCGSFSHHNIAVSISAEIGYIFFIAFGWGAYYIAPGNFDMQKTVGAREAEIPFIDWIITRLSPYSLIQNMAGMFLRGLFAAAIFLPIYYFNRNGASLIAIPIFAALMSLSYTLPPYVARITGWNFDYNSYAEGLTGACLGAWIAAAING